jgi:hypothetical protein
MGKSDEKSTKKGVRKATGESKNKNRPSFDTLESTYGPPLATTFGATGDGRHCHSQWCERFRQLCEYKVQFGHCRVPFRYSANPKLGQWVSKQRRYLNLHQEGKPSQMTPERMRALQSVGFVSVVHAAAWNECFEQLREYKVQLGHCRVPFRYSANPKLGLWVSKQRRYLNLHQEGKPSQMTPERMGALQSVGFVSDVHAAAWNQCFEQLREFKVQFGHCRVPFSYSANPKLGLWVAKQRQHFKLQKEGKPSQMTPERMRAFQRIGFVSDANATV